MNQLKNLVFAAILAFASFAASAANPAKGIFSDDGEGVKACLAALEALAAGKANTPTYKPLTNNPLSAPDFVKKSIGGKGGACLTGAYVQEDEGSKADFATVLVDEDFEYGYKVTGEKIHYRMAKCSNPFKDIIRLSAKVVEKQPELKAAVSAPNGITVVVNITNYNMAVSLGGTASTEDCGIGCHTELKLDKKVRRTDNRCLIAFKNQSNQYRYVLFDIKKGTDMLLGSWVADEKGTLTNDPRKTLVGDGKRTISMGKPYDCDAVYRAMSLSEVLEWTGPRVGLTKTCKPVAFQGS